MKFTLWRVFCLTLSPTNHYWGQNSRIEDYELKVSVMFVLSGPCTSGKPACVGPLQRGVSGRQASPELCSPTPHGYSLLFDHSSLNTLLSKPSTDCLAA